MELENRRLHREAHGAWCPQYYGVIWLGKGIWLLCKSYQIRNCCWMENSQELAITWAAGAAVSLMACYYLQLSAVPSRRAWKGTATGDSQGHPQGVSSKQEMLPWGGGEGMNEGQPGADSGPSPAWPQEARWPPAPGEPVCSSVLQVWGVGLLTLCREWWWGHLGIVNVKFMVQIKYPIN